MNNKKDLFYRYIDNLYSTDDARNFLDMVRRPENKEKIETLATNVWEDVSSQRVLTGTELER